VVLAGICSASLISAPQPTIAAAPTTVNEAIVEFTEALYPILPRLNSAFPPLTEQVGALIFNSVEPSKLAKSIDLSLDALTSVPPEKISEFNAVVKESFTGLTPDTGCNVVPLPPKSLVTNIAQSEAFGLVDKSKLSAWDAAWGGTLKLLPTTDSFKAPDGNSYSVICLPTPAALDKLALAQADVGRSIRSEELERVKENLPATLKVIRPTDAIPIAKTAEKLAKVPPDVEARLNTARKQVESAAKAEAYQKKLEGMKAAAAARKAAMK